MSTAGNQKMSHKAMANKSDQRTNQLKTEAKNVQECEEEQEIVVDDNNAEFADNTDQDF